LTAKWYYKELWGWDLDEICSGPERGTFLKALLCCANGDGLLTSPERAWVVGRAAAGGAPEELLDELEAYTADEDVNEIVGRTLATNKSRRAVVYFAIKAASSDADYSDGEKKAIRKAAAAMGLGEDEVKKIEQHVQEEERLKQERIRMCFPDGDPFAG
jgi:uncharacterized membrane protein YebE (DUF533 family)